MSSEKNFIRRKIVYLVTWCPMGCKFVHHSSFSKSSFSSSTSENSRLSESISTEASESPLILIISWTLRPFSWLDLTGKSSRMILITAIFFLICKNIDNIQPWLCALSQGSTWRENLPEWSYPRIFSWYAKTFITFSIYLREYFTN